MLLRATVAHSLYSTLSLACLPTLDHDPWCVFNLLSLPSHLRKTHRAHKHTCQWTCDHRLDFRPPTYSTAPSRVFRNIILILFHFFLRPSLFEFTRGLYVRYTTPLAEFGPDEAGRLAAAIRGVREQEAVYR